MPEAVSTEHQLVSIELSKPYVGPRSPTPRWSAGMGDADAQSAPPLVSEEAVPTARRSSLQTSPKEIPLHVHFPPESILASVTEIPPLPEKKSVFHNLKRVTCCCICCCRVKTQA